MNKLLKKSSFIEENEEMDESIYLENQETEKK